MNYGTVDTSIGEVFVAASQEGVCAVAFGIPEEQFKAEHPGAVRNDAALARELDLVRRYLAGEPVTFEDVKVDVSAGTSLQRAVWRELLKVPRGTTVSYSQLAARAGRPKAAMAVGNIVGQNPVPIVVPCHRVIHADGTIGGYSGGLGVKRLLHKLEKITCKEEKRISRKKAQKAQEEDKS